MLARRSATWNDIRSNPDPPPTEARPLQRWPLAKRNDRHLAKDKEDSAVTIPAGAGWGGVSPEQDFKGVNLQDLTDLGKIPDLLCFASFYGGEYGIVAFSWLANFDRTCCAFIESLKAIPDKLVTAALLRFFFTHCENVHMKPDWWESLPEETRDAVIERMMVSADPIKARPKAVLADDGVAYDPWPIVSRRLVQ